MYVQLCCIQSIQAMTLCLISGAMGPREASMQIKSLNKKEVVSQIMDRIFEKARWTESTLLPMMLI